MATEYKVSIVLKATDEASKHIATLGNAASSSAKDVEKIEKAGSSATKSLRNFETSSKAAWQALLGGSRAADMTEKELGELATSLGVASKAEVEAKLKMDQLVTSWEKGEISSEQLAEGMEKMNKKSKGLFDSLTSLKGALLGAGVVAAGKALWELGELGAQSLRTARAFDAISGGSEEATKNLAAMKRATRGAMSEQQMMAQSSRLMQMGLARNSDELEDMTTMAVRLGTAMGRDASQSVEEFALLLANQSIPRLDTFGISAGKVRARIAELQAATEGLGREEAFLQAVREEGMLSMDRLGEATEDEMLATEQLTASMADLKAMAGEALAPAMAAIAGTAAAGTRAILDERTAMEQYMAVLGEAVVTQELMAGYGIASAEGMERLAAKTAAAEDALARANTKVDGWSGLLWDSAIPATAELSGLQADLALNASAVTKSFGEMEFDNESIWEMARATGATLPQLKNLALELGIATSAEIKAATKSHELTKQFEEGIISAEEYAAAMRAVGQAAAEIGMARERGAVAEYQHGTSSHPGGGMIVGEGGPEFLVAPRGTQVHPNYSPQTQKVLNDQRSYNVNINDQLAAALFMEQQRRDRLQQADMLM